MKESLRLQQPLLRNKSYLALMGSQLVSNLGDWLYLLALLTLVGFKWNASPLEISFMTLCMVVPMLIGGPLSGMLADRMERKRLMVTSDIVRIAVMALLVFVSALWQIYILLILKGFFDILFSPAKNGKLKEIVPGDQLEQAVSVSAIIEQGSKIAGPAIGGALAGAFGVTACFIVNACAFAVSAVLLTGVPGRKAQTSDDDTDRQLKDDGAKAAPEAKSSFAADLAVGIRVIAGIPVLAYGLLTLVGVLLVLQIADSQLVVLFREIRGMPEDLLGFCIGLSGVGTLLSTLAIKLLRSWTPLVKMASGGALMGFVFAGAGLVAHYGPHNEFGHVLFMVGFLLAGFGSGLTFLPFQITLQQQTPVHQTGRVFGTVSSVTSAATLLGPVIGGLFVSAFGATPAFILSGSAMTAIGVLLLLLHKRIANNQQKGSATA